MSYEYQKVQNTGVARDSLNAGSTTLRDIQSNNSNSVQITVLGGHIDVVGAGGTDTRIHLTDRGAGNKLYTLGGSQKETKQLPDTPGVVSTNNGNNLGLEVEGTSCTVIASVYVGEEY